MTAISRPLLAPLLFVFVLLDILLVLIFTIGADWAPLWAAARLALVDPSHLYDFEAVTRLQEPIFGALGSRPFVYPPSALAWLVPFAVLPFVPALMAFIGLGGLLFARAAMRIGASPAVMLAPPVVLAALAGQTSFLVGGLGLAALSRLRSDAIGAGILFGLAASIKPTLFILAPIALLAGGHYRALAAAAASGLVAILLSFVWFGIDPWFAWFDALPRFQAVFLAEESLVRTAVTPYALAARFGLHSPALIAACALMALAGVIMVFQRSSDAAARSVALFGGALLITPYAMNYELALLAPAVLAIRVQRWRDLALPVAFSASLFATASVAGLVLVWAWFVAGAWRSAGDDPRVKRGVDVAA